MLDVAYALIFGGCCANVFALEAIVKHEVDTGFLITVNQFLVVSLFSLPSQLRPAPTWLTPRLNPPSIPLDRLAVLALLFFAVNMLNNWAFAFDISVPMHIILRSFGSVTTLAVGWVWGKRYSRVQVAAVLALTAGCVTSAWADARAKGAELTLLPASSSPGSGTTSHYAAGLGLLLAAQLLSAGMGIYTETTYAAHGRQHWRDVLFYTHALSLALSLAFAPTLRRQLAALTARPAASPFPAPLQRLVGSWAASPHPLALLALNAATQVVCIYGVNRLCAVVSAVTVTVVLNVRKLASFLLSCALFGNSVPPWGRVGAVVVFAAGGVYGWDGSRRGKGKGKEEANGSAAAEGKKVR